MYKLIMIPDDDYMGLTERLNKIGEEGYLLEAVRFTRFFKFKKVDHKVTYVVDAELDDLTGKNRNFTEASHAEAKKHKRKGFDYIARFSRFFIYASKKANEPEIEKRPQKEEAIYNHFIKRYRRQVYSWILVFAFILISYFFLKLKLVEAFLVGAICLIFGSLSVFNYFHVKLKSKNTIYYPIIVALSVCAWIALVLNAFVFKTIK